MNTPILNSAPRFDSAGQTYQQTRMAQWDKVARMRDSWRGWGGSYHHRLAEVYRFLVSPGQRVLEIGCGLGDLLAAVEPAHGGDISTLDQQPRPRYHLLAFIGCLSQEKGNLTPRYSVECT